MTAIASITRITANEIRMLSSLFVVVEPKIASTEGASTMTPLIVPIRLPVTISQPVMKPR